MPLQLLCRFTTDDATAWRARFDADGEDQRNAGLTVLQIWTDADTGDAVVLFDVTDRARAEGWIERARADTMGRRAGVTGSETHFLRTA